MLRGMVFIDHMNFDIALQKYYKTLNKPTIKAFYNSYDIAFFLSVATDYIKVYEVLKSIGKITVVVGVKGRNVNSIRPIVDNTLILDEKFFDKCKRDVVVRR